MDPSCSASDQSKLKLSYGERNSCVSLPTNTSLCELKKLAAQKFDLSSEGILTLQYYDKDFSDWMEADDQYKLPACGELRIKVYDDKGHALNPEPGGVTRTGNSIKVAEPIKTADQPADDSDPRTSSGSEDGDSESTDLIPYCTEPMDYEATDDPDGKDQTVRPKGTSGAYAQKTKIWRQDTLKVYFMNPEYLKKGKYTLEVETVMAWARTWNTSHVPNIPKFERTYSDSTADIRVEFGNNGCWSKIGTDAKVQDRTQPTMLLSLRDMPPDHQRHLVIHEFGHSLGLLHEHQRSDFWKEMETLLNVERMKKDPRMSSVNFKVDILECDVPDGETTPYDADSVMHYWFDVKWLADKKYQNLQNVLSSTDLSDKQRLFLEGIHKRNQTCASHPSKQDLEFLQECYSPGTSPGQAVPDRKLPAPVLPTSHGEPKLDCRSDSIQDYDSTIDEIALDTAGIDPRALNQRLAEKHLLKVAKLLEHWEVYAELLDIPKLEITNIEMKYKKHGLAWEKPKAMLTLWQQRCYVTKNGHYRRLLQVILEANGDRKLVAKICALLAKK